MKSQSVNGAKAVITASADASPANQPPDAPEARDPAIAETAAEDRGVKKIVVLIKDNCAHNPHTSSSATKAELQRIRRNYSLDC
jgi:hypothetical protein